MASATLTSKGQITIPKVVRESLCLRTGDKLEFLITESKEVIIKPITRGVDDVFGRLYKPGRRPVSVRKMNSGIRRKMRADLK